MKVTSSVGDEYECVDQIYEAVGDQLRRTIVALKQAMEGLDAGDASAGKEIKAVMADLRRAQIAAVTERQKLDEDRRKNGELGRGEVDLDAARSEIVDRLARLRNTPDAGCVSE
ncbi:hypothetical protein [Celeribacter sp.]|uniref:hypothetical protein n=1 Tax=Celeribacter sp. TaxID=1890673 RepID=UPI003A8DFA93